MFFCSCQGYTYIEEGFTSKLTDVLQRQYEVTIPESAELITGYYDNAFKDNCLYLVFTIDAEDIETILSENWEINKYNNEINLFENIIDIRLQDTTIKRKDILFFNILKLTTTIE